MSGLLVSLSNHSPSMMSFNDYSKPSPQAKFSSEFFKALTFREVLELDFPDILLPQAPLEWSFSDEIPGSVPSTLILPGEAILHINNLQPIMNEWQSAFAKGLRSVKIILPETDMAPGANVKTFQFAKVIRAKGSQSVKIVPPTATNVASRENVKIFHFSKVAHSFYLTYRLSNSFWNCIDPAGYQRQQQSYLFSSCS